MMSKVKDALGGHHSEGRAHLRITIINVRDLRIKDLASRTDPYLTLKVGLQRRKTAIKKNAGGVFVDINETFDFDVHIDDTLELTAYDHDMLKDDFLGRTSVFVRDLLRTRGRQEIQLQQRLDSRAFAGCVTLEAIGDGFGDFGDMKDGSRGMALGGHAKHEEHARFRITIVNVRQLGGVKASRDSDPYIILRIGDRHKKKTSVRKNAGGNAEFNETFEFMVNPIDAIELTAWDSDMLKDDFLGRTNVQIKDLLRGGGGRHSLELHQKDTMQSAGWITVEAIGEGFEDCRECMAGQQGVGVGVGAGGIGQGGGMGQGVGGPGGIGGPSGGGAIGGPSGGAIGGPSGGAFVGPSGGIGGSGGQCGVVSGPGGQCGVGQQQGGGFVQDGGIGQRGISQGGGIGEGGIGREGVGGQGGGYGGSGYGGSGYGGEGVRQGGQGVPIGVPLEGHRVDGRTPQVEPTQAPGMSGGGMDRMGVGGSSYGGGGMDKMGVGSGVGSGGMDRMGGGVGSSGGMDRMGYGAGGVGGGGGMDKMGSGGMGSGGMGSGGMSSGGMGGGGMSSGGGMGAVPQQHGYGGDGGVIKSDIGSQVGGQRSYQGVGQGMSRDQAGFR